MILRTSGLVLLAAVVAAAFSPGSSLGAAAATRPECRAASKTDGARIVDRSRLAVVFRRKDAFYGCVYGSRAVRRYGALCCEGVRVDVAGRYVGYTYQGTAIGDGSNKLGVFNLRTGTRGRIAKLDPTSEGGGPEIDTGALVPDFLVTSTGALVWLRSLGAGEYELRAGDGEPLKERIVDTGRIRATSLARSDGGRSVTYVEDGVMITTRLRS